MQEALSIRRRLYPNGHMDLAWSLNNMGLIQKALDHYEDAEDLFRSALAMRKNLLGEEHPHVAQSLGNLASLYFLEQRYQEAASMFHEVIEIDQTRLGEDNLQVAIDYNNLATVLNHSGNKREALEYYRKALDIVNRLLPSSHPTVVRLSDNKADVHMDLQEYDQAEQLFLICFNALMEDEGMENHSTQAMSQRLAELYELTGETEKASYYHSLIIQDEHE